MAAIKPFRHALVYPRMLNEIERRWRERDGEATTANVLKMWSTATVAGSSSTTRTAASATGCCPGCCAGTAPSGFARSRSSGPRRPSCSPTFRRPNAWPPRRHPVAPDGARRSGGAALPELLRTLPAGRVPAAGFAHFSRMTDRGYRWVAAHRSGLSGGPCRARRRGPAAAYAPASRAGGAELYAGIPLRARHAEDPRRGVLGPDVFGVDDDVVVRRKLRRDAVEALEVVGAVGVAARSPARSPSLSSTPRRAASRRAPGSPRRCADQDA